MPGVAIISLNGYLPIVQITHFPLSSIAHTTLTFLFNRNSIPGGIFGHTAYISKTYPI